MQADGGGLLAVRPPPPRPSPPFELLRIQTRVVSALMMREIYTRFGRDNIGFAWIAAEPAIFCLAVIGLWSISRNSGHAEIPIVPFILTGYMPLLLYRHLTNRMLRCMQANGALLYHRQITVLSLYSARVLVEVLGTSAAFAIGMIAFYLAGYVGIPDDPTIMLGGWLLYAWYAAATSIAVGALSERSEVVDKIWQPVSYINIPLSGTFYMLYWLPDQFRQALAWMPPVNGVEMIRGGYFGPGVPTYWSAVYLAYVNAIITVLGLYFVQGARRHVEIE